MQELKVLPGSIYGTNLLQKILSQNATIRRTVRMCHSHKNNERVQQSEAFFGSVKIKVLSGSVAIMCTAFKVVLQLKVHEGISQSKYFQGVSQFKY